MSIIHIERYENPFAQISKSSLWDDELSLEAVGLLARLLCRPESWQIRICELCKSCKSSKARIYRIINELIEAGYCKRHQPRSNGRFVTYDYTIFEFKNKTTETQKNFTEHQNSDAAHIECEPQTSFPRAENQTLIIKSINNNKEISSSKRESEFDIDTDVLSAHPKRIARRSNVATTEVQHNKLLREYGSDFVEECYEELSLWKDATPLKAKKSKSDYISILRWVIDRVKVKRLKEQDLNLKKKELEQREKRLQYYETKITSSSSDSVENNRSQAKLWQEHFRKMRDANPSMYTGKNVVALQDRIEIQTREGHCVDIPYSLKKEVFNEKCLGYLNSMVLKNKNS